MHVAIGAPRSHGRALAPPQLHYCNAFLQNGRILCRDGGLGIGPRLGINFERPIIYLIPINSLDMRQSRPIGIKGYLPT